MADPPVGIWHDLQDDAIPGDPSGHSTMKRRRFALRPRRDIGADPDYRFSLANERTFLAWIRTSLALVAGGLAATQLLPDLRVGFARPAIGGGLVVLGTVLGGAALARWTANEEAMRLNQPIPASRLPAILAIGVGFVSVGALILLLLGDSL